jgi:RNA recognition motif-containing protein
MGKRLYVGNLSFQATQQDLEELFGRIGPTTSVAVITDRNTGQSRGFGFVEMESADDAARAISELDGQELKGRALRINEAREDSRGGGGGGGGGGYRGGGGGRGGGPGGGGRGGWGRDR